jgi:hypothetical protein
VDVGRPDGGTERAGRGGGGGDLDPSRARARQLI